ncbi:MAG: NAD(+) synthase [Clostridium sp.]|nr:NAD(+) synthase [Acetatifactor muris]MCM1527595.1 NAD(+) synthase [Bacteroides sp.]MCM1563836.1 NAD(+) synthase [Clostridium sp.]
MRHGFVKVAAATPKIKVADPAYNALAVCEELRTALDGGAKIIVFPELCLTGYTCGDLFLQERLLEETVKALLHVASATAGEDALVFVGLPVEREGRLYNVAAALQDGRILGMVPKVNIPSYAEFYEGRHFTEGNRQTVDRDFAGHRIPFGANLLFECSNVRGLTVGCEICEDLWVADPPSTDHALAGATVIVNLSASNETVGKDEYRELLVKSASARLLAGYVYTSAGEGESTQDLVFGGHNLIAENGTILSQSKHFTGETISGDLDVHRILTERRRMGTFGREPGLPYRTVPFKLRQCETVLQRTFACMPFVPGDEEKCACRCEEILSIQSYGLKKRYEHTGLRTAVVGISGGLDSTLALLVTVRAFDMLGLDRRGIIAVTMPCFGTTDRTLDNARRLAGALKVTLETIDIREAVTIHFRDIGQSADRQDATYENGQARERTQVLMDIANREGGLLIGTGDLSELALGWATYNGDHMSMYGVNAGVPKTLVRHLVQYYADTCGDSELKEILTDVLDTPVSPELLPPVNGEIAQRTEDLVGPYELHDFFLYYMLRCGFEPAKVYRVARSAFKGLYEDAVILKWLKVFYRRFFSQQFKRSCLPDGPKVGSVALSPRGDLRMPSDASVAAWMTQLEELETGQKTE